MEEELLALKQALDTEKKGYGMYLEASANSDSEVVRNMFKYLATQELVHIKRIEAFDDFLSEKLKEFNVELSENITHLDEAKEIFKKSIEEWKEEFMSNSDLKVLEAALNFEKSGYNFYKEHKNLTSNKKLKEFFTFLEKEEDMHYHFIQNMKDYIENPVQFNVDEENWFFEG